MTARAKRMLTIISDEADGLVRRRGYADTGPLVGSERVFIAIQPEGLLPLHDDSPSLIRALLLPTRQNFQTRIVYIIETAKVDVSFRAGRYCFEFVRKGGEPEECGCAHQINVDAPAVCVMFALNREVCSGVD